MATLIPLAPGSIAKLMDITKNRLRVLDGSIAVVKNCGNYGGMRIRTLPIDMMKAANPIIKGLLGLVSVAFRATCCICVRVAQYQA